MTLETVFGLLLVVLAVSLVVWSVETYFLTPRRQKDILEGFRAERLNAAEMQIRLSAPNPLAVLVRNAATFSLFGLFGCVFLGRMDIDFSLVLVLATVLSGLFWGLDFLLTRRQRNRYCELLAGDTYDQPRQLLEKEPLLVEYAHSFFPVLAVVLLLRSFLLEPFTIPSGSMLPTLEVGDYILVNKFAYGLRLPVLGTELVPVGKPQRGDIMVFKFPPKPSMNFIKRVIGLPGDHIRTAENGDLFVNGELMARKLVRQEPEIDPWELYYEETLGNVKHITRQEVGSESRRKLVDLVVPPGYYFMMGDNRDNSNDSRYWGPVPESNIVGKAFYVWVHKEPGLHAPSFARNGSVR